MPSRSISILGCGWLGWPFARYVLNLGAAVKGSTTSFKKLPSLKENGIQPFLIECHPHTVSGDIESFLQSDTLFLNIPFKRDLKKPADYFDQIKNLISALNSSPIRHVIFASSTLVYPENFQVAYEDEESNPANDRAKILRQTEDLLRGEKFQTTILRFAGLFGSNREWKGLFKEEEILRDPQARLNLVHLEDSVKLSAKIFLENSKGNIFNVCCDEHPTREEFYRYLARKHGLKEPKFRISQTDPYKIVSNEKIKKHLNYVFQYPSPLSF